jgi:hypothetical protein
LKPRSLERRILPDKGGFCQDSLSVITTNLPSKKEFPTIGTLLRLMKTRRFIDSTVVPAQDWRRPQSIAAFPPSPEIYHPSG